MIKFPEEISDFESYICRDCTKRYPFLMNGKDEKFSFGLSKQNDMVSTWILPRVSVVPEGGDNDKPNQDENAETTKEIPNTETVKEQVAEEKTETEGEKPSNEETDKNEQQTGEKRKAPDQIERTDTKKLRGDGCTNGK